MLKLLLSIAVAYRNRYAFAAQSLSLEEVRDRWLGPGAVRDVAGTAARRKQGAAERFRETAERLSIQEPHGKSGCRGIEKPHVSGAFR